MNDIDRYAITVRKVLVDGEELWRATVREFPDLEEYGETRDDALALATDLIESLREGADQEGRPFPEPIEDEEEYTGRVTLRMPKSLHRAIAQRAMDQGVSLNTYIVSSLGVSLSDYTRLLSADVPDWRQNTHSAAEGAPLQFLTNAATFTTGAAALYTIAASGFTSSSNVRIVQIPAIPDQDQSDFSPSYGASVPPPARSQARRSRA